MSFDRGWQRRKGCLDVFLTVVAVVSLAVFALALIRFAALLMEPAP